uniref:Uncharacterized protein n=1 Tax=Rhizophagus irregularis (strain DAOM 181602 / DAOM 197198 / MUCL 43194) TaxID=747089 RepID=U9TSA1_RHIID
MSPFWQKIYEPMTQNEQAFNEVLNDIDDKEWDTILNSVNEKSAAGLWIMFQDISDRSEDSTPTSEFTKPVNRLSH